MDEERSFIDLMQAFDDVDHSIGSNWYGHFSIFYHSMNNEHNVNKLPDGQTQDPVLPSGRRVSEADFRELDD